MCEHYTNMSLMENVRTLQATRMRTGCLASKSQICPHRRRLGRLLVCTAGSWAGTGSKLASFISSPAAAMDLPASM